MQQTPAGFEQRLLARARTAEWARGECVVVGFSGGRDSLALAAALRRVRDVLGIALLLVHVDHGLRVESADEATQAAALADRLNLAFTGHRLERPAVKTHPNVGVEEAARRERYAVLARTAASVGARAVATGHHEGDQAETVLLHLLRGSGVHGAGAMREWSALGVWPARAGDISQECCNSRDGEANGRPASQHWLWRPLLRESRDAIDAYVGDLGLPWIEDASNADVSLRRNALRHEVLPLLEARFPGATRALARYAELAAADDDVLGRLTSDATVDAIDSRGRLRLAPLADQMTGMQRRIVRRWLERATGEREFSAERIDAALGVARDGGGGRTIEMGGGWTVGPRRGMLGAWRAGDGGEGET